MDPDKAVTAYVAVCQGYPIEVINAAILKFLRGGFEHASKRFCPTPPELSDMLRDVLPDKPHGHARESVDSVDAAYKAWNAPTPEASSRVAEIMRKYHAGIPVNDEVASRWAMMEPFWKSGSPAYVGSTKAAPQPKPRNAADILAEMEAHASDPIGPVSPALLKALGQQDEMEKTQQEQSP
jgi:hypothetical protein